ncbi:hypothetical protein NJB1507_37740 [Mycobacterium marinum]|uniref:hypothetical protein n=1 Tax=Mycobacterium marinum TaxID=1781 RepID=UPI0021C2A05B|nr:hypothetical protein [Mycobacterium marinum]GJO30003.1 hypothetical protein NJB1507_37740 [Mycobacterium marinum]
MSDYWSDMSASMRAKLSAIAWRYLRLKSVPDAATALELVAWQQLECEILEAHNTWLRRVKRAIESSGCEYTRESFLQYCREHGQ